MKIRQKKSNVFAQIQSHKIKTLKRRKIPYFTISIAITAAFAYASQVQALPSSISAGSSYSVSGTEDLYDWLYNYGTLNVKTKGILYINSGGILNNYSGGVLGNSGTLTNYSGGTLSNYGALNNYSGGPLTNYGILANYSKGILTNYDTLNNYGTLTNYSGGKLTNKYYTLTNSGRLDNYSTLTNESGTLINSGTLTNYSGGILTNNYGTLNNTVSGNLYNEYRLVNSSTLKNYGKLYNNASGYVYNDGTLINSGTLDSSGDLVNSRKLDNDGTLNILIGGELRNLGGTFINNIGGTFTNNTGGTLNNYGLLSNLDKGAMFNMGTLSNYGIMTNDGGSLFLDNFGLLSNSGGTFYNSGDLWNSGTLNNNSGGIFNNTNNGSLNNYSLGTLNNDAGSTLNNDYVSYLSNWGTLNNAGLLNNYSSLGFLYNAIPGGILYNYSGATLNNNAGGTLNNAGPHEGSLTNNNSASKLYNYSGATLNNNADSTLNNGGLLNNDGLLNNAGLLNNVGGTLNNTGLLTNSGTINNSSTFNVTKNSTVNGTGSITQTAGQLVVNGNVSQHDIAINGGVLIGAGIITTTAGLDVGVGGKVAPGDNIFTVGTLSVNGGVNFSGGKLNIMATNASHYSVLNVNGAVNFNKNSGANTYVNFTFGNEYTPGAGDTLNFLNAGGGISGIDSLIYSRSIISNNNSGLFQNYLFNVTNTNNTLAASFLDPQFSGSTSIAADTNLVAIGGFTNNAGNSITNNGNFQLTGNSTLNGGGTFTQNGGSLMVNGVMTQAQVNIENEASLYGDGAIISNDVEIYNGSVNPGNSPGSLEVVGNMTFNSGASLNMEVNGATLHSYDILNVSNTLTFSAGSQIVFNYTGANPSALAGESFDVFSAGNIIGYSLNLLSFNGFNNLTKTASLNWNSSHTLESLNIRFTSVAAVPVPSAVWLFGSALTGLVSFNRSKKSMQEI